MRLDKFLKISRLIKRRTLAKEVCDQGRVSINGRLAKAATEVKEGDHLTIDFGSRVITVEIVEIKENATTAEAKNMYRILE